MANVMTYESLYDTKRREITRNDLQKLPENFFEDVAKYLEEKKTMLDKQNKKDNVFSKKEVERTKLQLKNGKRILKELIEKREFKIMQLASSSNRTDQDYTNMMHECEVEFYENLKGIITKFKENVLNNTKKVENKEEISEFLKLEFLEKVPQFMGEDMNKYGPFECGNIADIPPKVANILLTKKNAEIAK